MFNRKINEVIGMLLQFRFSNFRCFSEETVFDMTATPIKEHRYSLLQNNGVNILPVAAIYGNVVNLRNIKKFIKNLQKNT
jgi:hypothetical protein